MVIRYGAAIPPLLIQPQAAAKRQRGSALIICLLMLLAVLMLGTSSAQIALQEEKASRGDHDRQIALQSAEAALKDAEQDIESSARSDLFSLARIDSFTKDCGRSTGDRHLGLCLPAPRGAAPVWKRIGSVDGNTPSVPYGHFTGQTVQAGAGGLSAKPPRYIIELVSTSEKNAAKSTDKNMANTEETTRMFFRITAIGFGRTEATQVVLQTYYQKGISGNTHDAAATGRMHWREILNWEELRDAL